MQSPFQAAPTGSPSEDTVVAAVAAAGVVWELRRETLVQSWQRGGAVLAWSVGEGPSLEAIQAAAGMSSWGGLQLLSKSRRGHSVNKIKQTINDRLKQCSLNLA